MSPGRRRAAGDGPWEVDDVERPSPAERLGRTTGDPQDARVPGRHGERGTRRQPDEPSSSRGGEQGVERCAVEFGLRRVASALLAIDDDQRADDAAAGLTGSFEATARVIHPR